VVFAGLPDITESEGFDRSDMKLPACQDEQIGAVADVQPNTVVVLAGGSPVEMPWIGRVKAVLQMHLAGQAGGPAAAELLMGAANPCGKLAATYPVRYADVPSAPFFGKGGNLAEYREGIYVGYRYYDKAGAEVLFPFGHGLSYTRFELRDLEVNRAGGPDEFAVRCTVRNTGVRDGSEVVQLYVGSLAAARGAEAGAYRPERELRAFEKVPLRPGEERSVRFLLDRGAFAWYDSGREAWVVPGGTYRISLGVSSRDIRVSTDVIVRGDPGAVEPAAPTPWYAEPGSGAAARGDLEALLDRRIVDPAPAARGAFTLDSTLHEMRSSLVIRVVTAAIEHTIRRGVDTSVSGESSLKMVLETVRHSPIRSLSLTSPDGMRPPLARALVAMANGRYLRGLRELWRGRST
jgi:beta-glucosidase